MRTRFTPGVPLLLALLTGLGSCSTPRLDVMPRVEQAKFGGHISASSSGVTAQSNDVANDLGLNSTESEFGGRVDLTFGGAGKWTFAWSPAEFSGNGTLTEDITYNGTTITAGTPVASDVTMNVGTLLWTHDFIPGDNLELGLGLGAHVLDFHTSIKSATEEVKIDETVPVPVLAARAGAVFGPIDVSALVSGLKFNSGGDDATFFDTDVMARWHFLGGADQHLSAGVVVGWKKTDTKFDVTDNGSHTNADLNVSGIYYGISIGF